MHKRVGSSTVCTVRGLASLWLAGMCLLSCDWLVWSSLNMLRTSSWHEFLFVWAASSPECWLLLSSVFNVRTSNLHWSMSLSSLKGCYYSVVRSDKLSRSVCESDDPMLDVTFNLKFALISSVTRQARMTWSKGAHHQHLFIVNLYIYIQPSDKAGAKWLVSELINISDVRSTSDTQLFLPVYCSVELWPQSGLIAVQCLIWLSSAKISFSVGRENYEAHTKIFESCYVACSCCNHVQI